jgi:hypothetical protein
LNAVVISTFDPSCDKSWGEMLSRMARTCDLKDSENPAESDIQFDALCYLKQDIPEVFTKSFGEHFSELKSFEEKTTFIFRFFERENEEETYSPSILSEGLEGFNRFKAIGLKSGHKDLEGI